MTMRASMMLVSNIGAESMTDQRNVFHEPRTDHPSDHTRERYSENPDFAALAANNLTAGTMATHTAMMDVACTAT